jgi:hypothetical protein
LLDMVRDMLAFCTYHPLLHRCASFVTSELIFSRETCLW